MGGMNASEHRGEQDESYSVTLPAPALSLPDFSLPDYLKARFTELAKFHRTPQGQAFWEATKACVRGDEAPIQEFIEERIGQKPPAPIRVRLQQDLQQIGELMPKEIWEFIEHHAARLKGRNRGQDALKRAAEIRRGIKKFPSLENALDALALEGQKNDEVLEEMIPGVAYVEQVNLPPDSTNKLPGRVASQIRREGLERPDEPNKVFAPEPETLQGYADYREAQEFALREFEIDVNASPQELESWTAAVLLRNKEAAQLLGRAANQIGQEKYRTNAKFRRIV
jgi:hypothetical protein